MNVEKNKSYYTDRIFICKQFAAFSFEIKTILTTILTESYSDLLGTGRGCHGAHQSLLGAVRTLSLHSRAAKIKKKTNDEKVKYTEYKDFNLKKNVPFSH